MHDSMLVDLTDVQFEVGDTAESLDITLAVEFDFSPAERTTYYEPGCPASVDVTACKVVATSLPGVDCKALADYCLKVRLNSIEEAIAQELADQEHNFNER